MWGALISGISNWYSVGTGWFKVPSKQREIA